MQAHLYHEKEYKQVNENDFYRNQKDVGMSGSIAYKPALLN